MTTDNPYAGTPDESQWQAGYDSGIASPGGIPSTPLILASDQGTIWSEGALAGFTDGEQEGFHTPLNPPGEQPDSAVKVVIDSVDTGLEAGIVLKESFKFGAQLSKGVFELGALPISVFLLLLSVESPPPPTVTAQLQAALEAKCAETGQDEVFAALCRNSDHSDTGDWFLNQGYWHGNLNLDFWPAYQDAVAHFSVHPDAAGNVGVAHYLDSAPDQFEFIILQLAPATTMGGGGHDG